MSTGFSTFLENMMPYLLQPQGCPALAHHVEDCVSGRFGWSFFLSESATRSNADKEFCVADAKQMGSLVYPNLMTSLFT